MRRKIRSRKHFFILALKIAVWGLILFIAAAGSALFYFSTRLPDPSQLSSRPFAQSTKIFDHTGTVLLYDIHGEEKRTIIPLDQIPDIVKKATLAAEDSGFYKHKAISARGIIRAVFNNITRFELSQGGSTITQQLAKNAFLTPERSISRKIKEAILSFKLEKKYTKDEILYFYLNQIPYGSNVYGIETASQTFFNKPAKEISIGEAAVLAGMIRAPTYYLNHQDQLQIRRDQILKRMEEIGWINDNEYIVAKSTKVKIGLEYQGIKAPHFVMYIKELLEEKYGVDVVEKSGWQITTTLDWDAQKLAEKLVKERALVNSKQYGATNAALLAEDPKTGDIIAMVGSRDYFDVEIDGNFNVTTAKRQPGSSIKPFVYLGALEKGYTDKTIVFDLPTDFDTTGQNPYTPENYDKKFAGPVTLREALAQSRNIPSVKVLYLTGLKKALEVAKRLGISTLDDPNRYGLTLVLGGGEVKMTEMVKAYSVLSQGGLLRDQRYILQIKDSEGNIIEDNTGENIGAQIAEPEKVSVINSILSDDEARAPLYGRNSTLNINGWPTAAKTGTTDNYYDTWTFGYTPNLVVGVWAGNNYNKASNLGVAGLRVAPLWHDFMEQTLTAKNTPKDPFSQPQELITDKIMLNGKYIGLNPDNSPVIHNILYWINKDDPQGPIPDSPEKDAQFYNWEKPVSDWVAKNYPKGIPSQPENTVSQNIDTRQNDDYASIQITKPKNGDFIKEGQLEIEFAANLDKQITKIVIYLNGSIIDQYSNINSDKFSSRKNYPGIRLESQNEIKIEATDTQGTYTKKIIVFK